MPENVLDKPVFKFNSSTSDILDESSDENNHSDKPSKISKKNSKLSLRSVLNMPELLGESGELIVRLTPADSEESRVVQLTH